MRLFIFLIFILLFLLDKSNMLAKPVGLCNLADLSSWQGLIEDPALSYNGSPSPKWEQSKSAVVKTEDIPHDWSNFSCLEFALHSQKATGSTFMVVLGSENSESEGSDYFNIPIKVDWEGWKHFIIHFNELSRSRLPVGFHKIDYLMFTAEGWNMQPHPEAVLNIADLRLTDRNGPWTTDAELFESIDLERTGLERVKEAINLGNLELAKHELAEYMRNRKKPVWKIDPHSRPIHKSKPKNVNTTEADLNLQHNVISVGVRHRFNGDINWNLNPIDYREWPWQLNRHHGWVELSRAYWDTGEEKYAEEFVRQLLHWARSCPSPKYTSGNQTYTWRTIESGIRAGQTWMEIYHRFLTSPSFSDEALITMLKLFKEHAQQLMKYPTGGNWLTMEANGLMHIGVIFPEFKDSAEWRKTAIERLYRELDRQVYPDGAQIELSSGYHQVSLINFRMAWEVAKMNDIAMPSDYIKKLQKMYDYNLLASMPDGCLPGLNDGNRTNIRGYLKEALQYFPERKDYEWVATEGKQGTKPSVGSIALPFSGQLIMRSGWEKEDMYLMMDAGPFGYGHQHEDKLSIVIYAHGKYHLVDPGNYPYDSSKWRRYIIATPSHNTVMVDGEGQHRAGRPREQYVVSKPLPNKWISSDGFDYASGTYDEGYGQNNKIKVVHTRNIFFVKPEYWIITDFLNPDDKEPHRYESIFHLDAERASLDEFTKMVITENRESANLAIIPLFDDKLRVKIVSGQEDPVQGWVPAGGYKVRPVPTPIFSVEKEGKVRFLYIFFPVKAGEKCPINSIKPLDIYIGQENTTVGVEIRFANGRIDYFIQTDRAGKKIKFLDFETDAEAALVSLKDGLVIKAYLAGGTRLLRAGKPVDAEVKAIKDLSETDVRHVF
ncbi:MAG: heparinase II/III family protein [Armatimonadetes bacterium]|nr:heparinase II/III family protein [Armatimonadota bacterium]